MSFVNEKFRCSQCLREFHVGNSMAYAILPGTKLKICYDCVATIDAADMMEKGKAILYLQEHKKLPGFDAVVTNWPGTLVFTGWGGHSDHNIAGKAGRRDVWFTGPDGHKWHGVNIGNNQILRCQRLKERLVKPLNPNSYIKPYAYNIPKSTETP